MCNIICITSRICIKLAIFIKYMEFVCINFHLFIIMFTFKFHADKRGGKRGGGGGIQHFIYCAEFVSFFSFFFLSVELSP